MFLTTIQFPVQAILLSPKWYWASWWWDIIWSETLHPLPVKIIFNAGIEAVSIKNRLWAAASLQTEACRQTDETWAADAGVWKVEGSAVCESSWGREWIVLRPLATTPPRQTTSRNDDRIGVTSALGWPFSFPKCATSQMILRKMVVLNCCSRSSLFEFFRGWCCYELIVEISKPPDSNVKQNQSAISWYKCCKQPNLFCPF